MGKKDKETERVRQNSASAENRKIDRQAVSSIKHFKREGKTAIDHRITSLEREWDVERTLELNASVLALSGVLLGAFVNKRWLILTGVVSAFLIQHAVQGWCPPLPVFRKMGKRTRAEIDREKYALKALRKDFKNVNTATEAWRAVTK